MLDIEKMPTAVTADKYPVHKWFNFVAGYSPEYINMVINEFVAKTGHNPKKIYDPFSGCATTNVVANQRGIPSEGVERNPFFFKVGYTKAHSQGVICYLEEIAEDFMHYIQADYSDEIEELSDSAKKYLAKLFDNSILGTLLRLKKVVNSYSGIKYYMGYTFLSKIIEYVTTAKTDGIYRVPTSKKKALDVESAIEKAKDVFQDGKDEILQIQDLSRIVFDTSISHKVEAESCDLVIFSPPYLNNFDFAEMTRMQMYFWNEASSWGEISEKHRNHMLVNTTTALKLVRDESIQKALRDELPDSVREKVDPIVTKLNIIRKENSKKKEYGLIIYPYLAQMRKVLVHCYECLDTNGEIHIVLSDAAFYGIHIDTQEYIKNILEEIGFKSVLVSHMRARGNRWILEKRKASGKQLGEFEIVGVK